MISIVIAILLILGLVTVVGEVEVNAWPADTSEQTKNKILTVQSDHELTVEESGIAEDKVFEISTIIY
jgi:Na+-transporting methylmalonyl-CoA/oxaloacetate decarboxylase gamma subunit